MYECLYDAPREFWEEYADLPDDDVNYATNQKYRERAAPYHNRASSGVQRVALLVAVVGGGRWCRRRCANGVGSILPQLKR